MNKFEKQRMGLLHSVSSDTKDFQAVLSRLQSKTANAQACLDKLQTKQGIKEMLHIDGHTKVAFSFQIVAMLNASTALKDAVSAVHSIVAYDSRMAHYQVALNNYILSWNDSSFIVPTNAKSTNMLISIKLKHQLTEREIDAVR